MEKNKKNISRSKFLKWSVGLAGSIAALRFFKSKPSQIQTVKMLAEDGTLIEVDAALLNVFKKKKISDKELLSWIKKN